MQNKFYVKKFYVKKYQIIILINLFKLNKFIVFSFFKSNSPLTIVIVSFFFHNKILKKYLKKLISNFI